MVQRGPDEPSTLEINVAHSRPAAQLSGKSSKFPNVRKIRHLDVQTGIYGESDKNSVSDKVFGRARIGRWTRGSPLSQETVLSPRRCSQSTYERSGALVTQWRRDNNDRGASLFCPSLGRDSRIAGFWPQSNFYGARSAFLFMLLGISGITVAQPANPPKATVLATPLSIIMLPRNGACDRRSPRSPAQPNALRRRPRPGRHLCLQQRSTGRRTNSNTRGPDDRSRPVHCVRRRTATSAAGPFCAEQRTAVSPFRCSQPAAEVTSPPAARAAPHPPRAATHPPEAMSPRATAGRSR